MYKNFHNLEKHHQLIASFIVGVGLISVWRGIWGVMDLYLMPDNPLVSYVLSFVFGVGVLYITHKTFS